MIKYWVILINVAYLNIVFSLALFLSSLVISCSYCVIHGVNHTIRQMDVFIVLDSSMQLVGSILIYMLKAITLHLHLGN